MQPRQCKSNEFIKDLRCQGIPNHTGPHWAYDPGGHLIQWANKREKSDPKWENIACSWIPPEHSTWISPVKMDKHHYLTIWAKNERKRRRAKQSNSGN